MRHAVNPDQSAISTISRLVGLTRSQSSAPQDLARDSLDPITTKSETFNPEIDSLLLRLNREESLELRSTLIDVQNRIAKISPYDANFIDSSRLYQFDVLYSMGLVS